VDRQKQRRRSHPDRACHGIDSRRPGKAKTGTRRSDCYARLCRGHSGQAAGTRRRKRCRRLSGTGWFATIGRCVACGITFFASSSFAFASDSIVTTEFGFTQLYEKSMTILNVSLFQRFYAQ
jgi:hypothetical protein